MRNMMAVPLLMLAFVIAACGDPTANYTAAQTSNAANVPDLKPTEGDKELKFSQEGSKLSFLGAKVTAEHPGGFDKFSGTVTLGGDGKTVRRVVVDIDTTTLWSGEAGKGKEGEIANLTKHLKSPDFFDVEKYPTAQFITTEIKDGVEAGQTGTHTVSGNLTMVGQTKLVKFPATIKVDGGKVTAQAKFKIDRTDWGIVYKGKMDDLIKNDVGMEFDIAAK